jgi:serine/threonine protein kinase
MYVRDNEFTVPQLQAYISPEILIDNKLFLIFIYFYFFLSPIPASNIYSIGMSMFHLLNLFLPFNVQSSDQLLNNLRNKSFKSFDGNYSIELKELVMNMISIVLVFIMCIYFMFTFSVSSYSYFVRRCVHSSTN